MRVRTFELRLVAIALTALWFLGALYVLLGYRPGGPIDGLVGAAATLPMAIALAAVFWPPVARSDRAFAGIVWLGLLAGLLLVPSIGGVLNQLLGRGPQTLLPSVESAYPWLVALTATSLFAGLGIARRVLGETALRRSRLVGGTAIGVGLTVAAGSLFAGAAIANDIALRDQPAASSRFGPTGGDVQPPPCDGPLQTGSTAAIEEHLSGDVDGRPVGSIALAGERDGADVRWSADVAADARLGRFGMARLGSEVWTLAPPQGWVRADPAVADEALMDVRVMTTALDPGIRATAENHGVEFVEGARGRRLPGRRRWSDVPGGVPAGALARRRRYPSTVARSARLLGVHGRSAGSRDGQRERPGGRSPGRRDPGHDPGRARRDGPRCSPDDRRASGMSVGTVSMRAIG